MQATTIHSLSCTALVPLALTYLFVSSPLLFLCSFFKEREQFPGWYNRKSLLHHAEEMIVLIAHHFLPGCSELELCCLIISGSYLYGHQRSKHVLPNYEKFPSSFLWFYVVLLYCFLIKFWSWSERFYKTVSEEKKMTKTKIGEIVKEKGIKLVPFNSI